MRNLLVSTMDPLLWVMAVYDALSIFLMFRQYRRDKMKIAEGLLPFPLYQEGRLT
ncbi:MAG: hypothetical protein K6A14_06410 [Erysipelotrichaceae bacterium]|nr:hypothetical protein [Erysipelotrichaceae bacterium]